MSNNNKIYYIPRVINQNYILIWKRDEVMFILLPCIFVVAMGNFTGFMLTLTGILLSTMLIKSFGTDRRSGYLMHWFRYNVPQQIAKSVFKRKVEIKNDSSLFLRSKAFPPSHIRHIAG